MKTATRQEALQHKVKKDTKTTKLLIKEPNQI